MRLLSTGIAVLAFLSVCSSVCANELTSEERAALDFSIKKVSFGTTLNDFKRKFPAARQESSDKSLGTSRYRIYTSDNKTASFGFFRGRVYEINRLFRRELISEHGGTGVLKRRLLDMFGTPYLNNDGVIIWRFPDIHRTVSIGFGNGSALLSVKDTAAVEQMESVQASKLDLGF